MQIWKRTISVFLVLSMVFTMLPVFALAEETEQPAQAGTVVEELTEASLMDALSEEQELPEQKSSDAYPWDGMTDEEFADWVMAEENRAYIISLFDEDNADTYEALMERIEQIEDDDTYSEVCDYLMTLYEEEEEQNGTIELYAVDSSKFANSHSGSVTIGNGSYYLEYGTGGYFTADGGVCKVHDTTEKCFGYYIFNASQCFGYARYIQYKMFGKFSNRSSYDTKDNNGFVCVSDSYVASGQLSVNKLKEIMARTPAGAHLRTNDTSHSMIIMSIDTNGFKILQCNGRNGDEFEGKYVKCGISTHYYTWESYCNDDYGKRGIKFIEYCTESPVPDYEPSKEIDTRFSGFLPIELCYTADANTAKIPLYDSNLNQYSLSQRNITNTDDCKILEIYTNGYCKVDYPSGSSRNVEYAKLSDFIPNVNVTAWTADAKYNTYRRSAGYEAVIVNSGTSYVDPGDNCLAVGYKDGRTQIIYPSGTGKKMGWIERSYPAATQSQPSGNVEYSTSTDYAGMKSRADAILNYTWTPTQRIETWNGNKYNGRTYFEAGETVSGMPYTLFTSEVTSDSLLSLAQYVRKAGSNYSTTAYCNSTSANRTGPVYGSCCATFVSEVFGGNFMYGENPRYDSVRGIINSPHGTTRYNVPLRDVQPGDALSNTEQHHIIWVSEVTDSTITFYEQTPPIVQKQTISKSSVDGNGYLIYNGATYNIQTKNYVEDTLPTSPTPLPAWSLMQGKSIVALAPSKISIASNQYISAYDLCIIRDFNAENGQCTVVYPSGGNNVFSNTQRTATMNLTNMVAYNADFATQHLTATKSYDVYPLSDMDAHGHTWALDPGDEFYTINRVGNATEVLYYCSRGVHTGYWKLGWIYLDYHYLDLNCVVDGTAYGTISECGTVDMILNGESYGKNITDFYMEVPYGSTYRFENLRCTDATYKGVKEGRLEGQVTGKTDVVLEFTRNNPCEISTSVQKDTLTVSWDYVPWASEYNVRIFKDTNYTGTEYSQWGVTENSCKVQLPLGHYYVYVDSCTASVAKQSNIVELDITECVTAITVTPTIPGAAQAGISVTAPEGGWKEGTNTFTVSCAKPCVVAVSYDGGQTYVRLTASDSANGKSFTAENMTADTQIAVVLKGDFSGDGRVNNVDVARIKSVILKRTEADCLQALTADVTGDGRVNNVDVARIKASILRRNELVW